MGKTNIKSRLQIKKDGITNKLRVSTEATHPKEQIQKLVIILNKEQLSNGNTFFTSPVIILRKRECLKIVLAALYPNNFIEESKCN